MMSKEQPRVVIVTQHYPPDKSGNASRIHDTAKHLSDEDWQVIVLAPPPAFPHGQFERTWKRDDTQQRNGVIAHRLWAWQPTRENPGFLSRMAYYLLFPLHAFLWLLFNYRNYDAVITSSPPIFTGLAALPFGLVGGKPWLVDVRDLWIDASIGLGFINEDTLIEQLSRAYEKLVLETADRVTVTTNILGERLVDRYGINDQKIVHLPNGVDTDKFHPRDNGTEPTIVYTGNVGHAQDLESCIQAMKDINHQNAMLKIVGDGDIKSDLERLTAKEDLEDSIEFTGLIPRTEIPEILSEAMVGLAPLKPNKTLEYAIPTKAYEYMACELPVVATGTGEIETLIDESNGGIFAENTPDQLGEIFESLLTDSSLRKTLGEQGRQHMIEHYDRRVVSQRLDRILTELLDNN